MNLTLDTTSWIFWALIIIVILVLIWFFFAESEDLSKNFIYPDNVDYLEEGQLLNNNPNKFLRLNNNIDYLEEGTILNNNIDYLGSDKILNNNVDYLGSDKILNNKIDYLGSDKILNNKIFNVNRGFKSEPEKICCKIFEEFLGRDVLVNNRPKFLKNPETGESLEYDCYDPISLIAIEYNGEQHYNYPNGFHKSEDSFNNQVYRDNLKKKMSLENGIKLIIVPFTIDTCKINDKNIKGYTKMGKQDLKDREEKIKKFLLPELEKNFNSNSFCKE